MRLTVGSDASFSRLPISSAEAVFKSTCPSAHSVFTGAKAATGSFTFAAGCARSIGGAVDSAPLAAGNNNATASSTARARRARLFLVFMSASLPARRPTSSAHRSP
jgi:hypothetical protein